MLIYQNSNFGYFADIWLYNTDFKINTYDKNMLEFAQNQTEANSYSNLYKSYKSQPKLRPHDFLTFDKIAHLLNGYARIVFYQVYSQDGSHNYNPYMNPRRNRIVQMKEGQFKNGKANGYVRTMDMMKDASVGFFKEDRAYGKVQYYQNGRLTQ